MPKMKKLDPLIQFTPTKLGRLFTMGSIEKFEDKVALAIKKIIKEMDLKVEGTLHCAVTNNSIKIDSKQPNPVEDGWTHSRE